MHAMRTLVACVGLVAATASIASAELKSWTAIKAHAPAKAMIAVSVDVAALRTNIKAFVPTFDALVAKDNNVKQAVTLLASVCKIQVASAISDVSLLLDHDGHGVIALGLDGLDEPKLVGCMNAIIATHDPKAKVAVKPGKVTEYGFGPTDKVYATWPAKDVVVISTDPDSRTILDAALKGKPAAGELGKLIAKVGTSPAWFVMTPGEKDVKSAYGTLAIGGGTLTGSAHVMPGDAKKGADMLAEAKAELPQLAVKLQPQSKALANLISGVKVGGTATDISFDAALTTDEAAAIMPDVMMLAK